MTCYLGIAESSYKAKPNTEYKDFSLALKVIFSHFQTVQTMNKRKSSVQHAERPSKARRTEGTTHSQEDEELDVEAVFHQEHHYTTSVCQLSQSSQS